MEATPPTGWPARLGKALTSRWALPALTLTAFAVSLLVQHTIFPALSWNRDEAVYLWHVDVLRAGQLSTTDGGHPDLFQPWLSAARDGTLFSQYTLGWPLVLLAGSVLGSTDLAVAAGAALAVAGTWALVHELSRDRALATVAALFMLVSPILLVQSGGLLNYLFTLGPRPVLPHPPAPGRAHRIAGPAGGQRPPARLDLLHPALRRRRSGASWAWCPS